MKDHRFIELVNLYVDRQISAAETAELEEEIQANPRRRDIYRQYCQMHRATALVYESFRADPANQQTDPATGRATVARFEQDRPRRGTSWVYYAGGLAAACLALGLVRVHFTSPAVSDVTVAAGKEKIAQPAVVAVVPPSAQGRTNVSTPARSGPVSLLANGRLPAEQDYAAMLVALRQQERQAFANGQIQPAQLPSLFDDGVFDSQQSLPVNDPRAFRARPTPAAQVSYQFQR